MFVSCVNVVHSSVLSDTAVDNIVYVLKLGVVHFGVVLDTACGQHHMF